MAWGRKAALLAAGTAVAAIAAGGALAQQGQRGPTAVYWVSAATATGFGAGMEEGQRPSAGQIMSMMRGGGGNVSKTLTLQLGSARRPTGEPQADHLPPASLGAGQALPLLTPKAQPAPRSEAPVVPPQMQRPQGRMLIFWGCGENAGPGQPLIVDFAQISAGKTPAGMQNLSQVFTSQQNPPSPARNTTYGEWPNERARTTVPAQGSLVGEHVVRGNYSPEIKFTLSQNQDFLGPLVLTTNQKTPSGAGQLGWRSVPNAKAYHAVMMGSGGGAGGGNDVVMWSSSQVQAMAMLPDYLSDAEITKLVGSKALMPASATSCTIPRQALAAAPSGMVQLAAYGGEANFSHPARPAGAPASWSPEWIAKVRYKSTTGAMLGMSDMMAGDGGAPPPSGGPRRSPRPGDRATGQSSPPPAQPAPPPRRPGLGDVLRGGLGLPGL